MSTGIHVLVVDDEPSLRGVVSQVLTDDGHETSVAESGEAALELFKKETFQLVFSDIRMGGMNGLELLQKLREINSDCQVIIMTSHASLDSAVTAMRSGAYDYLIKPFDDLDLISAVANRAIEKVRLIEENRRLVETLRHNNEELTRVNDVLKDLALRDGLTGLFNHRSFQETLSQELARSRRHARALSIVFMDVDYFKKYNDANGHPEGDRLLRALADLMKKQLRTTDILARYGGEEFVIILPETIKKNAQVVAEGLRKVIEKHPFAKSRKQPLGKVTVSMGISAFPEDGQTADELVRNADAALYKAKEEGRNRVCLN